MYHIFNANKALLQKISKKIGLSKAEQQDLLYLPDTLLICYLNGFEEAVLQLEQARQILKNHDRNIYQSVKLAQRILRKVHYN